ncbi:MAG: hypothetical protein WBB27_18465, partial [Maribacter sp.]
SQVDPNMILDIDRYIDRAQLPKDIGYKVDELLADNYINASIQSAKRTTISPESFVELLNVKGVVLSRDIEGGGKVKASIPTFNYKTVVNEVGGFLSNIDLKKFDVSQNFDDIRFKKANENGNIKYAFYLLANEKLSNRIFEQYKDLEKFKPLWNERELKKQFTSALRTFKHNKQIGYTSELKIQLKDNPTEFLTYENLSKEISVATAKQYLAKYISEESINESIRFEREHFTNTIELSKRLKNGNISALMGLRDAGNGTITDLNGKYEIDGNLIYPKSIETFQEQSYFNYYSTIFQEVTFHLYGDNRNTYKLDYSGILVYESFKNYLPETFKNDYQKVFEKSYMEHFARILSKEGGLWSDKEKIAYLNSKGMVAVDLRGDTYLKIGGSNTLFEVGDDLDFKDIALDKQISYLTEHGFVRNGVRRTEQLHFVVSIEKENYTEAVWLLKQNKASLSLSGVESNRLGKLKQQLEKLEYTPDSLSKSIINTFKQEEGGDGYYKGFKGRKNKLKKGPRL